MARFNGNAQQNLCINGDNGFGIVGLLGNGSINTAAQTPTSLLSQHLPSYSVDVRDPEGRYLAEPYMGEPIATRAGRLGCFAGAFRCREFARFANSAIQSRWPLTKGAFPAACHQAHLASMPAPGEEKLRGRSHNPSVETSHNLAISLGRLSGFGKRREKLLAHKPTGKPTTTTPGGK